MSTAEVGETFRQYGRCGKSTYRSNSFTRDFNSKNLNIMQSPYERRAFRLIGRSQPLTPYSRRIPESSYRCISGNFESQKGRTLDPNAVVPGVNAIRDYSSGEIFFSRDPLSECYQLSEDGSFEGKTGCKMSDAVWKPFSKNAENCCRQGTSGFQCSRYPVQMIGNLSLTEVDSVKFRITRDERDLEGKNSISKAHGEKKVDSQSSDTKRKAMQDSFQFRQRGNQSRIFSGSVDKVIHWFKLKSHFHLLFEVIAVLVDFKEGKFSTEKFLILKDEKTGPSLLVTYYEIDRPLPELKIGGMVKCIGRLTSRNCLQAFKVEQSTEQEKIQMQRLFFISNLAADEAFANQTKK